MVVGVTRFYAFSLGQSIQAGDIALSEEMKGWFNTALLAFIGLSGILALAGYPIGMHFIETFLVIPSERFAACILVFKLSLAATCVTVLVTPFVAMFNANQRFDLLALCSIVSSALRVGMAYALVRFSGDKLEAYGALTTTLVVVLAAIHVGLASLVFRSCRIDVREMLDLTRFKRLFGFVSWKMFGMSCVIMRNQFSPILINITFGPILNASYLVAQQVALHSGSLAASLVNVTQPTLTAAQGRGDLFEVSAMASQVSRLGAFLTIIFVTPLFLEIDAILAIWLVHPPAFSSDFCRWLLALQIIDRATSGAMLAINAKGDIVIYELIQGLILFMAVPLIWLFFSLGSGPNAYGFAVAITMGAYCFGRLIFAKRLLGLSIICWWLQVGKPVLLVTGATLLAGCAIQLSLSSSIFRILTTSLVCVGVALLAGWRMLLTDLERAALRKMMSVVGGKVHRAKKLLSLT